MAIIYSYPQGSSALQDDRVVITRINEEENEITTKQLTIGQIADYVVETSPVVSGTGTPNYIPIWGPGGGSIVDSQLKQVGPSESGLYQIMLDNADRFIINKPSSITSGDPEYLIQQDGEYKVSFGWDDDGDGFGFLYNWSGAGIKLGSAGNYPMVEIKTTEGSEQVDIHKTVRFVDYGSGTKTGTGTHMLSVDANGNVKEFSGTPNFLPIVSDSGGYLDKSPLSLVGSELISNTKIVVRSDSAEVARFVSSNSLRCSIKLVNNNGAKAYITSSDECMSIGRNDGLTVENLNVTRRGLVGIGTTIPKSALEVRGHMTLSANLPGFTGKIKFNEGFSETTIAALEYLNEGDVFHIKSENPTGNKSRIRFSVANNGEPAVEAMRIVAGGQGKPRVIIGNPDNGPERELYVDGSIDARANIYVQGIISCDNSVDANSYKVKGLNVAPASSTSEGLLGEIRYTADYIYVCVAENTWRRTALTTW